jgi:hypothetical protein
MMCEEERNYFSSELGLKPVYVVCFHFLEFLCVVKQRREALGQMKKKKSGNNKLSPLRNMGRKSGSSTIFSSTHFHARPTEA